MTATKPRMKARWWVLWISVGLFMLFMGYGYYLNEHDNNGYHCTQHTIIAKVPQCTQWTSNYP